MGTHPIFESDFDCLTENAFSMKAIRQSALGDSSTLFVAEDAPRPIITADQVLVRIQSSALNRADIMMREGRYPNQLEPRPLGLEGAGTIVEVGSTVTTSTVGDEVMCLFPGAGHAEFAAVNARHCLPVPHGITMDKAGGIMEVWLTAFQLLYRVGSIQENDVVFVHAAASGVGTSLIQLAKRVKNVRVIASASSQAKLDFCRELGADLTVNYKKDNVVDVVKEFTSAGVNLILDPVGGSMSATNADLLARDGEWILYGLLGGGNVNFNLFNKLLAKRASIKSTTLSTRTDDYKASLIESFHELTADAFKKNELLPIVDKKFKVDDIVNAHLYMESNQTIGKVLLAFDEPKDEL